MFLGRKRASENFVRGRGKTASQKGMDSFNIPKVGKETRLREGFKGQATSDSGKVKAK